MRLLGKTNIDFMKHRKSFYWASVAVIAVGLSSFLFKGIDLGIDFLGGTEMVIQFPEAEPIGDIRSALSAAGFPTAEIKTFGTDRDILIRTTQIDDLGSVSDRIREGLTQAFPDNPFVLLREDRIGPRIGAEMRRDAIYAIIFSLIAILVYIGFRFKFVYGVGAVLALFHDVLATLGIVSLLDGVSPFLNLEINQNMIAAFLTLVGLSVNDTVVVFDRIRENLKVHRSLPLAAVINRSINDTLSRTIITSGTSLIVLVVLFLFGGEVTRGFAFALIVGVTVGTYSSIYIASAIVLDRSLKHQQKSTK